MNVPLRCAVYALALTAGLGTLHASGPVAVYALIDKVNLEPSADHPDRVRISRVFITSEKQGSAYSAPQRGYLYFSLPKSDPERARQEWSDLQRVESIKGLFPVLCSVFPSFDSAPNAYEKAPCRALPATLAAQGYRTGLFHSGLFGYLGMESIIRNRGYQTMEDAGDIGGNHHSSFGVDEPLTVRRMLAWIDALPRGQRFFLTYLPIAGHHPYATPAPGPFAGPEEIDQYRDALHYGDVSLGALRDGLRARGLEDDTVWVVYGDHGEAFGQHQGNYAHTFFLYEENVHVPFLIAAPGLMTGQKRVRKVVSLVDTAPTILNLLGITLPAEFQGRTMLDGTRRMALFFTDYSLGLLGLRDGPWKFIYEMESRRAKLFDLRKDSQEVDDLAGQNGARALWYRNLLREWSSAQKAWITQAR